MQSYLTYLNLAHQYAEEHTGCTKVSVGALILDRNGAMISIGANKAVPNLCKTKGCLREEKYGENTKNHRNPDDCRAIHSEIDAISSCRHDITQGTIIVTRYPCENCARAIVQANLSTVVYGRQQEISDMTKEIFEFGGVKVVWLKDWDAPDTVS